MPKKPVQKFRKITVRIPFERSEELDTAAAEKGLDPAVFARICVLDALNVRRNLAPQNQITKVNS